MKKIVFLVILIGSFILLTQLPTSPMRTNWRRFKLKAEMFLCKSKSSIRDNKRQNENTRIIQDKQTGKEMRKPSKLTKSDRIINEMN